MAKDLRSVLPEQSAIDTASVSLLARQASNSAALLDWAGEAKGKSAIPIARVYAGRQRNFVGQHFWARGYWVSTVGKNGAAVRQYIQDQEKEDKRLEQLELVAL